MIKLNDYTSTIKNEMNTIISKFILEHDEFYSMGIYSCPWSGWISLCFNKSKSISDCGNNCPNFEFVEYGLINLPEWESEYNSDKIEITDSTLFVYTPNLERDGDEAYNKIFFEFLISLSRDELKNKYKKEIFIQMLDSQYEKLL